MAPFLFEFIARFRENTDWFGSFSEQALPESSFLDEKLVHRFKDFP